jgi:transposase
MARYKLLDTNPQLLSVDLARQRLPGTFEHALNHLLDHEGNLAHFDARFRNYATDAPAYPPAMWRTVVLFAYSQGIVRSRANKRVCQEHVTLMAGCGMTTPHFPTIAHFVSSLRDEIAQVFAAVLAGCDGEGVIGRGMVTIDGVKLPSSASTHRSGPRAESAQRAVQLEAAATILLDRHRATDAQKREPDVAAKTTAHGARLTKDAEQLRAWLVTHPTDRHGPTGGVRKNNRTDRESAKMATDKGVIQGSTGVAAVEAKHPIMVDAQVHGTGSAQELRLPVVDALAALRTSATLITADAGYLCEANRAALAGLQVTALIADPAMWKRDERFADRAHDTTAPNPVPDKSGAAKTVLPVCAPSNGGLERTLTPLGAFCQPNTNTTPASPPRTRPRTGPRQPPSWRRCQHAALRAWAPRTHRAPACARR